MLAAVVLALTYTVTAISIPVGMTVDLPPDTGPPFGSSYNPAIAIALSQRGSFAAIMHPDPYVGYQDNTALLVIRADGSHVVLTPPPATTVSGEAKNPLQFRSVALASDGTPFTTISFRGGGMSSSRTDRIYSWNGRWHNELQDGPLPIESTNVTIAAADTPTHFACNGNYADTWASLDQSQREPHYQEYQALLINGDYRRSLGYGSLTAMRGQFVVGYDAGVRSETPGGPGYPTHAIEWNNNHRTSLGPGIAYGVNVGGDAVGDDESLLGQAAVPTLWQHGHKIQLAADFGSALAIADDGTVVGRVGEDAFIVRGTDSTRKLTRLDTLVRPSGWHISSAYAIAGNGRILAVGHRLEEPPRILLLDPR